MMINPHLILITYKLILLYRKMINKEIKHILMNQAQLQRIRLIQLQPLMKHNRLRKVSIIISKIQIKNKIKN